MKKWYKIAFNTKLDEGDLKAMNKYFFQTMDDAMGISECTDLKILRIPRHLATGYCS